MSTTETPTKGELLAATLGLPSPLTLTHTAIAPDVSRGAGAYNWTREFHRSSDDTVWVATGHATGMTQYDSLSDPTDTDTTINLKVSA